MIVKSKSSPGREGIRYTDQTRRTIRCWGNKPAFILNVEAASEKRDGRWENYYVDVKIWGEHPEMEDMYQKGDYIEARGP